MAKEFSYRVKNITRVISRGGRAFRDNRTARNTFINFGTNPATVLDNIPLAPGATLIFEGNLGEVDRTIYNIAFPPPASGTSLVIQVQTVYLQEGEDV